MTVAGWSMILLFLVTTVALAKPAGNWLFTLYDRADMPGERALYRLIGVDPEAQQSWVGYAASLMVFNVAGVALLFAILLRRGRQMSILLSSAVGCRRVRTS